MVRCINRELIINGLVSLIIIIFACLTVGTIVVIGSYAAHNGIAPIIEKHFTFHIIKFTVLQAILSTAIIIILGGAIARALHRNNHNLVTKYILKFLGMSFFVPSIVSVIGLSIMHGKKGWVHELFSLFGISLNNYLYDIYGIILGNIAVCLPMVVLIFYHRLNRLNQVSWKMATLYNISEKNLFSRVEMPEIVKSVPSLSLVVLMLCMSNFGIVLSLGRGPIHTTIEFAIYQALRFDFNIAAAVMFSIIHFAIFAIIYCYFLQHIIKPFDIYSSLEKVRYAAKSIYVRAIDYVFIFLLFLLFIIPISAVILSGMQERMILTLFSSDFWQALKDSFIISFSAALLAIIFASSILLINFRIKRQLAFSKKSNIILMFTSLCLSLTPFVLSTGVFIIMYRFVNIFEFAKTIIILINAVMACPFVLIIMMRSTSFVSRQKYLLCSNLGVDGINFFRFIYFRRIKQLVGYSFMIAFIISWGDMSVISLFGSKDLSTLPYLIYQNISHYKVNDAAVVACIMLLISYIIIWVILEVTKNEINYVRVKQSKV